MYYLLWILLLCLLACTFEGKDRKADLELLYKYELPLPEPSGLSLGAGDRTLWTVSDANGMVYEIELPADTVSAALRIVRTLTTTGEDLEGIFFDRRDSTLWLVDERKRLVLQYDTTGARLQEAAVDLTGPANSGLEGICHDAAGDIWLVNEKNPALILRLDQAFNIAETFQPDIAHDLSGIWPDTSDGRFWLVSDEDQKLFLWDTNLGLQVDYFLDVVNAEGLSIDFAAGKIYIVSDAKNTLYVFRYPLNDQ